MRPWLSKEDRQVAVCDKGGDTLGVLLTKYVFSDELRKEEDDSCCEEKILT